VNKKLQSLTVFVVGIVTMLVCYSLLNR